MHHEVVPTSKPLEIDTKYFEHEIIFADGDKVTVVMGEIRANPPIQFLDSGVFYQGVYLPIIQAVAYDEKARIANSSYADVPWIFGPGFAQLGEVDLDDDHHHEADLNAKYPHYKTVQSRDGLVRLYSPIHTAAFPAYLEVDPLTGSYTEILGSRVSTVNLMPLAGLNHRLELRLSGLAIGGNIEESVVSTWQPYELNLHLDRLAHTRGGLLLSDDQSLSLKGQHRSFQVEKFQYHELPAQIKSANFDNLTQMKDWGYNHFSDEWCLVSPQTLGSTPILTGIMRLNKNQMQINKYAGRGEFITARSQVYP